MPSISSDADQRETACLGGQLAGVRAGHPPRWPGNRPTRRPRNCRTAGAPRALGDRLGLPGQQRLVHLQARAGPDHSIRHQLVTAPQIDQVAGHQVRDRNLPRRAVTDHPDLRRAEHREPVQGELGSQLLPDPDQRVRDQDDAEQGILRLADGQDHRQQGTQDRVEPGQDVGPENPAHRAAAALRGARPQPAARAAGPPRCWSAPQAASRRPAQPTPLAQGGPDQASFPSLSGAATGGRRCAVKIVMERRDAGRPDPARPSHRLHRPGTTGPDRPG